MKRELSQEEMVEGWTLPPNELLLLMNKSGPGRLGFAALLKVFQAEARFPFHKDEISDQAIDRILRIALPVAGSTSKLKALGFQPLCVPDIQR